MRLHVFSLIISITLMSAAYGQGGLSSTTKPESRSPFKSPEPITDWLGEFEHLKRNEQINRVSGRLLTYNKKLENREVEKITDSEAQLISKDWELDKFHNNFEWFTKLTTLQNEFSIAERAKQQVVDAISSAKQDIETTKLHLRATKSRLKNLHEREEIVRKWIEEADKTLAFRLETLPVNVLAIGRIEIPSSQIGAKVEQQLIDDIEFAALEEIIGTRIYTLIERIQTVSDSSYEYIKKNIVEITDGEVHWKDQIDHDRTDGHNRIKHVFFRLEVYPFRSRQETAQVPEVLAGSTVSNTNQDRLPSHVLLLDEDGLFSSRKSGEVRDLETLSHLKGFGNREEEFIEAQKIIVTESNQSITSFINEFFQEFDEQRLELNQSIDQLHVEQTTCKRDISSFDSTLTAMHSQLESLQASLDTSTRQVEQQMKMLQSHEKNRVEYLDGYLRTTLDDNLSMDDLLEDMIGTIFEEKSKAKAQAITRTQRLVEQNGHSRYSGEVTASKERFRPHIKDAKVLFMRTENVNGEVDLHLKLAFKVTFEKVKDLHIELENKTFVDYSHNLKWMLPETQPVVLGRLNDILTSQPSGYRLPTFNELVILDEVISNYKRDTGNNVFQQLGITKLEDPFVSSEVLKEPRTKRDAYRCYYMNTKQEDKLTRLYSAYVILVTTAEN